MYDVAEIGITGAFGFTDRLELFGSRRLVRLDCDVPAVFIPNEPFFGSVSREYPSLRASPWLVEAATGEARADAARPESHYLEMPGLSLTATQARRLCGLLDLATCE